MSLSLHSLAALLLLTFVLPLAAQTRRADEFMDSIGVNVHAYDAYEKHRGALDKKLAELGVRHVRDGIHRRACEQAAALHKAAGIKTTFITGRRVGGEKEYLSPLNPAKISEELAEVKTLALEAAGAIEGPNEYDLHSDKRDADWAATLRNYQREVYHQVKADEALRALPVIGPSLTSEGAYQKAGDMDEWIDAACIHHYQSSRHPGTGGWGDKGYGSIDWTLQYLAARQSPGGKKPVWSTECGYQNTGGDAVSERAAAIYLPRMFAEFFRRGYARSFQYELIGDQWGLLRDDLSEKPAFAALKNLVALLKDPGADFTAATLDYTLSGSAKDLRSLPLARSDGSFALLLWREVPIWDVNAKADLEAKAVPVTVTFPQVPVKTELFALSDAVKPQAAYEPVASFEVSIAGELMVLNVIPARK